MSATASISRDRREVTWKTPKKNQGLSYSGREELIKNIFIRSCSFYTGDMTCVCECTCVHTHVRMHKHTHTQNLKTQRFRSRYCWVELDALGSLFSP